MKILLADDSMTAQNMGKKILTEAGYEVVAVSNGAAAVKKIAEQRPDVAVLDVYMPGYTGLEVCERLKSAHDTTNMPVLLTVGRMEPFKPEEGNRVKADGIIIKPFEASDLLAAIQKIEQRLPVRAAVSGQAEGPYEKTQKINIPYLEDFKDSSYEDWKVTTAGQTSEGERQAGSAPAFGVPEGMEGAPALGMDELEVVSAPATEVLQRVTQAVDPPPQPAPPSRTGTTMLDPSTTLNAPNAPPAPAGGTAKTNSGVWRALDKAREWFGAPGGAETPTAKTETAPVVEKPLEHSGAIVQELALPSTPGAEPQYEKTQYYPKRASDSPQPPPAAPAHSDDLLVEYTAADTVQVQGARDPHFEATSSPQLDSFEVSLDPDLEPTSQPKHHGRIAAASEPTLVTDAADLVKEFPTRFGVPNAKVEPVGMASDYPELYADGSTAEEELESVTPTETAAEKTMAAFASAGKSGEPDAPKPGWVAEEAPLEAHENRVKLHDEMKSAFSSGASAPEAEIEVELVDPAAESAEAEASQIGSAADPVLAAAMAAAVGAEIKPAVTHLPVETSISEETAEKHHAVAADIVHRVTELLKPELIKRIAAELGKKK